MWRPIARHVLGISFGINVSSGKKERDKEKKRQTGEEGNESRADETRHFFFTPVSFCGEGAKSERVHVSA